MPGLSRRAAIIVSGGSALGAAMNLAGCASRSTVDPAFLRQSVAYETKEAAGAIVVDPSNHFLYHVQKGGQAIRYGVGVGGEGFSWSGVATVNVLETMLYRTAERLLGRTFRERAGKRRSWPKHLSYIYPFLEAQALQLHLS